MKISGQQRKAISPIVATVLIIAATLIAAAAILGYVFGIFGGASTTANVTASAPSLSHSYSSETAYPTTAATFGTVTLSNSGTGSTSALTTGSITYGGSTYPILIGSTGTAICTSTTCGVPSNGALTVDFYVNGVGTGTGAPTSGETFNGLVNLANGESATFSGTFS